jgi:membrane-associated phospholipid phosphatase
MVDREGKAAALAFLALTTVSFAIARACSPLLPRTPLYTIAVTQTLARLVTNVHYPSDVAAATALGLLIGSAGR